MARRNLMAGNWKMNATHLDAIQMVQKLSYRLDPADYDRVEVAVCPPFTALRSVQTVIESDHLPIRLGAQNVHPEEKGAFTGEVSAGMLAKLGAIGILRRVLERLRRAFPRAKVLVRLDGGFADPERTSCTSFWANQMRVMLTAAAYVLMQELRLRATGTTCARAQVTTLRERLLKLGAWFERSVRRVVLHLPDSAPWRSEWCRVARSLGVAPS